ncbi:MAG: CdaR family protein, partial [Desulfobacterales bacterium]|nr:CdaR family protein [Desulfobacterales bacterium]
MVTDLLLPVEFSNIPDNMVLTYFHTDKLEVRVKADPRRLEELSHGDVHYPADIYTDLAFDPAGDTSEIEAGHYVLPVDKQRIPLDPAIEILGITPSYFSIRLENKVSKEFKVHVPYDGAPAQGHISLAPTPEPSHVTLMGAASLINGIEVLKTKPILLKDAAETFKKEVPLDLENPSLFSPSPSIILVTVPIQEEWVEKDILDIPIEIRNGGKKVQLEPPRISIKIRGPYDTMGKKEIMDQIHAFVDLENLKPGIYARHAYINVPVGLMMTGAHPRV